MEKELIEKKNDLITRADEVLAKAKEDCRELTPDEMQELAMNPKARILLRFHIGDVEKTVETLDSLFLSKNRKIRKQLIQDADVSLDDIDN